jgi:hypothetical protein
MTGRKAFDGSSVESVHARLNSDPEIPADASDGWRALLASMTAREPMLRASAMEIAVTARELATNQAETQARTQDTVAFAELLEPTKRYPAATTRATAGSAATTAATAVLGAEPSAVAAPPQQHLPRKARSKTWLVASGLVVVAIVGLAVWLIPLVTATPTPAPTPYPSVSGVLGTHLKQLQESVTP